MSQTAGQFLQMVLDEQALTAADVAEASGLSPVIVRRALNDEGHRKRDTVRKLAAAAGMTPEQAKKFAQLVGYSPAVLNARRSGVQPTRSDLESNQEKILEELAEIRRLLEALNQKMPLP